MYLFVATFRAESSSSDDKGIKAFYQSLREKNEIRQKKALKK